MKALNIHRKKSFDEAENLHKRQIIAEALELNESRIKRFIRILLSKSQIFHSNEEFEESADEIFQQTATQSLEKSIESSPQTFGVTNCASSGQSAINRSKS